MIICVLQRIFIQLLEPPIPPRDHLQGPTPQDDHLQPQQGHEKCFFETPHNEIKCVLCIKQSNFKFPCVRRVFANI